ncbi:hypothetical protein GU243_23930 (plasmid) [Pseudarthrobacter psychrotolerans]|uniref:Uncharacterized protein n=1 Tax=Pseudarthrobacter psychrotolerans TaxID=2697569 RepID=A0A6P1NQC3_9MICC|nr:hypothetical protein [Pseudarthrobacter psychrotolerans]QHK22616.1 hypothetical protein GU243_23930 [Pseudarthrobacter psychrotolerans]
MTDQLPLTARLGEPGQRDSQGFGADSTHSGARPITVTDADGNVVYEKQTADHPKSADSHISVAGYRRTEAWADGVASVERIPARVKLRKAAIVLGVLAIIVAGISIFISRSYALEPEGAVRGCHEAVASKLPAQASPEFKSTSSLKNSMQAYGGYLYVVSGDVRSLEIDGQVHDMTYRCEIYVDSSGTVHKATAGTTWK